MAKRKIAQSDNSYGPPPKTLEGHGMFGLIMNDQEQIALRDALWDEENKFVGVSSCAGSGKTSLVLATSLLRCYYGRNEKIIYMRVPTNDTVARLGYLKGDLTDKMRYFMAPLYTTLIKFGEDPYKLIDDGDIISQKEGSSIIVPMVDVYIRGDTFYNSIVFVDEAQNATEHQLRTIITRCDDSCLLVLAGSLRQVDLKKKSDSGFEKCLRHFETEPWAKVMTLSKNWRGVISQHGDLPWG